VFQSAMHQFELVKLCALWDSQESDRSNAQALWGRSKPICRNFKELFSPWAFSTAAGSGVRINLPANFRSAARSSGIRLSCRFSVAYAAGRYNLGNHRSTTAVGNPSFTGERVVGETR
jgi:hypothetical protein